MTTQTEVLKLALEALEEIALAGMSGTGQESEDGMIYWHARQAWKFIGIAARALDPIKEALAQPVSSHGNAEDLYVEMSKHLNCPHCSGSGHIDDVAQPEQEPAGVVCVDISNAHMMYGTQYLGQQPDKKTVMLFKDLELGTQLYTTPPQRTWVGLTDEERGHVYASWRFNGSNSSNLELCRAIEAKLKEKNK